MSREYGQYGYGRPQEGRGEYRSDSERYSGGDRDDYSRESQRERTPLEWDDRQYGSDLNNSPRQGGRSVQASAANDRGREGSNEYRSGSSERWGRPGAGPSNRGNTHSGGSVYESNDYGRNQSRYGSPRSEPWRGRSSESDGGSKVLGSNWNRTQGSGEWNSQLDRQFVRGSELGYGSEFQDQDSGRAWDQYYGTGDFQSADDNRIYSSRSGGYGQSGYGSSIGAQSSTGQSYEGQSRGGPSYGNQSYEGQPYGSQSYRGQSYGDQSHRGTGPKGYERSDERIKEIVCEALMDAPNIDASDISVEVKNREVKLTGTVRDRHTKYAAEELIERQAGNCEIHNELRVKSGTGQGLWKDSSTSEYGSSQNASRSGMQSGGLGASGPSSQSGQGGNGNQGKQDQTSKSDAGKSDKKY